MSEAIHFSGLTVTGIFFIHDCKIMRNQGCSHKQRTRLYWSTTGLSLQRKPLKQTVRVKNHRLFNPQRIYHGLQSTFIVGFFPVKCNIQAFSFNCFINLYRGDEVNDAKHDVGEEKSKCSSSNYSHKLFKEE